MNFKKNYNERLFNGWQSIYHLRRFRWLRKQLENYAGDYLSIVELGCFDARTIEFIPPEKLEKYLGLDANWEKGLDLAKERYKNNEKINLHYCAKPEDIPLENYKYNIGISLETLEHIPQDLVEPFLSRLASVIDGYFFITIPVERGFSLLVATIIRFFNQTWEPYGFFEWFNAFFGRMHKVKRREHKGFDDRLFTHQVAKYFDIVKTEGIFFNTPWASLNLGIGIIAKSKN
jgi:hypothetical protein